VNPCDRKVILVLTIQKSHVVYLGVFCVLVIQEYETTTSEYPYNGIQCNSVFLYQWYMNMKYSVPYNNICVTVIHIHEMIVSSVTSEYMKYNVQCNRVSIVLDDTSTDNNNFRVTVYNT